MDKTKCNKVECNGIRFRGRLCEEHFLKWKASQRRYADSLKLIKPKIYYNASPYTKISK